MHRADAEAVGDHLGAHAAGAVVDHEGVARRLEQVAEHRVGPEAGEGLGHRRLVVQRGGEVAERLQAVGQRRVALAVAFQHVGGRREAAIGIRPHDHRIGLAGDDLAAIDHGEDGFAGLALAEPRLAVRVARLVVDDRLAGRGAPAGGQAHFFLGQRVAVGAAALGQHDHLAEQAIADVARRALAAEGGPVAGGGEGALALGVEAVAAAFARGQQRAVVAADIAGDVGNRADRLQAVDREADVAVGDLVVDVQFAARHAAFGVLVAAVAIGIGLEGQQVLQVDGQAVAGGHAQDQRPWALVRTQGDLPRHRRAAARQGNAGGIHHVAAQGEHHAVDVLRAEAVEHQRLVEGDDVGHQGALALDRRLALDTQATEQAERQAGRPSVARAGQSGGYQ
ncbi:hypothetical protein D9M70_343700 [compost metagenome]